MNDDILLGRSNLIPPVNRGFSDDGICKFASIDYHVPSMSDKLRTRLINRSIGRLLRIFQTQRPSRHRQFRRSCVKGSSPPLLAPAASGSGRAIVSFVKTIFALSCQRSSALDIGSRRNDRLINLGQNFGSSRYLCGNAARDYIGLGLFTAAGIEVIWHNYVHPTYSQQHFCHTYRCSTLC